MGGVEVAQSPVLRTSPPARSRRDRPTAISRMREKEPQPEGNREGGTAENRRFSSVAQTRAAPTPGSRLPKQQRRPIAPRRRPSSRAHSRNRPSYTKEPIQWEKGTRPLTHTGTLLLTHQDPFQNPQETCLLGLTSPSRKPAAALNERPGETGPHILRYGCFREGPLGGP